MRALDNEPNSGEAAHADVMLGHGMWQRIMVYPDGSSIGSAVLRADESETAEHSERGPSGVGNLRWARQTRESASMFRRRQKHDESIPDEPPAVGWDAITAALERLYPDLEPIHRAPVPGPAFGGGVQGISAYPAQDYWHLVTYGLTELYDKVSDDADRSGWGYELTIRIATRSDEPPVWAFNLLERVAQQTQQSGVVYAVGHRIDAGAPIDGDRSVCTALAFGLDPELRTIDTPHGSVAFLQLVGITADELTEMKATTTGDVLSRIATTNPLLITSEGR